MFHVLAYPNLLGKKGYVVVVVYVSCEVLVSKDLPVLTVRDKKFFVFKLFDIDGVTFWLLAYRKRLFTMINNLPTVYEVVTGTAKKEPKDKTPKNSNKSNKTGSKVWSFNCTVIILHDK